MDTIIYLSNATQYVANLVVYKNNPKDWRLFWAKKEDPYCGVAETSEVTGQPAHATRRQAVAYADRRYGVVPTTAAFH